MVATVERRLSDLALDAHASSATGRVLPLGPDLAGEQRDGPARQCFDDIPSFREKAKQYADGPPEEA